MDSATVEQTAQKFGPYAGYAFLVIMAVGLSCSPELRDEIGQASYDTCISIKNSVSDGISFVNAGIQNKAIVKGLTKDQTNNGNTGSYTITFAS